MSPRLLKESPPHSPISGNWKIKPPIYQEDIIETLRIRPGLGFVIAGWV
jgi:hypothetical protein